MSTRLYSGDFETKIIKEEPFEACFVVEQSSYQSTAIKKTEVCHLCKIATRLQRGLYKHIKAHHPDDGSETMRICSDHCIAGKMIQTEIADHLMSLFISLDTMSESSETCEECMKTGTRNELSTRLCPVGKKYQQLLFNHSQKEHSASVTVYDEFNVSMTSCFCPEGISIQKDLVNHLLSHFVWIKEENVEEEFEENECTQLNFSPSSGSLQKPSFGWQDDDDLPLTTAEYSAGRLASSDNLKLSQELQNDGSFLVQVKNELGRREMLSSRPRRTNAAESHPSDEHYLLENRRYFCNFCSYVTVHKKRYRAHWEAAHDPFNPNVPTHQSSTKSADHPGDRDCQLEQKRYYCRLCSYVCDSKQRHRVHWDFEHDLINAHLCLDPSCSNRFQTAAEAEKHYQGRHLGIQSWQVERKGRPKGTKCISKSEADNLQCEVCSKEFASATKLRLHRVIHREKSFVCDICGFQSYTRAFIKIHMGRKHLTNFICGQCDESFSMKSKLNEHEKTVHSGSSMSFHSTGDNQLVCDQPDCGRIFSDKNKLKQHHDCVHSKVLCDQCCQLVAERHIERHMQSRHGYEKPFKCEFEGCKSSFVYRRSLNLHMNLHAGIRPFQCEYCSKAYVSKNSLAIHLIQHVNPNKHRCEICKTNFTTGQGLRSHLRLHSVDAKQRPFSCDHPGCNKAFKFPEHVRAHFYHCHTEAGRAKIKLLASRPNKKKYPKKKKGTSQRKVHKDYKKVLDETINKVRYLCEFEGCLRHFSDKRVLESHINTVHFGIKSSFLCEICSQSFATQKSLKIHQPIHLDYDSFSCKFCGKGYKSKSSLIYHEGTHTGHANRKPRKAK